MRYLTLVLFAATVLVSAQDVQITPLDNNTETDDFAPSPTQHGRMLIISSERSGKQQLYGMERSSSGWNSPKRLSGDVNDGDHVGAASVTSDGQTMVFSAFRHSVDGQGRTDLYMAKKSGGQWTNVQNLGGTVNSSAYDAQPAISADGRVIVFASDRSGGMGGTDLYITELTSQGWSAARPLEGANSGANEMSPIINADGKTITFASDRPGGSGGFDIYVARLDNSKASNVRNAGAPINTMADELFYASIPNSNQAFFARTTAEGDYDIYSAVPNPFPGDPVTLVEGVVRNATTKSPVGSEIIVTDLSTQKAIARLRSDDETGRYYVTLTPGRVYSVTAKAPGYIFHSERYEIPPGAKGQTISKDIDLSPIDGGADRLLVFFDFDKSELKSESFPDLERVIELLRENQNIRMRFEGHTDDQGEPGYNKSLSERRAKAVADYVISGGIDASRIESIGHGKAKPLVQGTSEEARALNRRVEMKVIK